MRVGVGYSDNPDTAAAGREAAMAAVAQARQTGRCDLVLLFATAQHDAATLTRAIVQVMGPEAKIVGGGAIGAITNTAFGYAGDQVGLAAIWLEGIDCAIIAQDGLETGEAEAGERLGGKLAGLNVTPESTAMLFYDAIDRQDGNLRLLMATPLLAGIEKRLGFLPDLVGAGFMGDFICTPTMQWIGSDLVRYHALALAFGEGVKIDTVILHGCRPASSYYTVTKAEAQTILEINGRPALHFIQSILGPAIPPEGYAFFLTFGINRGDKWGRFDEDNYANRLCLAIDRDRNGIVMFEPDMTEGTQFQIMHRGLDLGFMEPKLKEAFSRLGNRRPVFAFFIDCAGRAAGYNGADLEDAVIVQKVVGDRVPVLGIYSGVEIAPVQGKPRALDWTGVFCLFSVPE